MPVSIREFHRGDRDQLTALVNLHVSAVIPGVALSTNVVLAQLEREPGELIVDPWVQERVCLVAVEHEAVVAAALLHRFRADADVREGYRSAADLRWLIAAPDAVEAGRLLVGEAIQRMRSWRPSHIYADGTLPAPGCYGIPDTWPHIRQLLVDTGFEGPTRRELVMVARCDQLTGHAVPDATVVRSVGVLGARLDLVQDGSSLGYVEVGEIAAALTRSTTGVAWTDVGNLFPADPARRATVMPALLSAAAHWLLLGGVDRLIDYYADDVDPPDYLTILQDLGFQRLTTNERGWELARR